MLQPLGNQKFFRNLLYKSNLYFFFVPLISCNAWSNNIGSINYQMWQRLIISTNLVVPIFVIWSNPNYCKLCYLTLIRFISNLRDRVTQKQMMCRSVTQSLISQNNYLTVWFWLGVIIIIILFDFSISSFGFMIFNWPPLLYVFKKTKPYWFSDFGLL